MCVLKTNKKYKLWKIKMKENQQNTVQSWWRAHRKSQHKQTVKDKLNNYVEGKSRMDQGR